MAPKILIVLTSVGKIESRDQEIGWYLPELAHPYDVLSPIAELVIASPKGGVAPLDPSSIELFKTDESSHSFFNNKKSLWENTVPLKEFLGRASEFAAIFYPGGHGPMFDLVDDKDSIQLIQEFYAAGKPVAAVCHGPAAFVNVTIDGQHLVKDREVTCITNVEEELLSDMPFLLEDALRKAGGKFVNAPEKWGRRW
ncbi:Glutathione-independent glyoxalase HSP31-like protein [Cladobotryum mycophilum]|uniref:D-lactate dehydratase n=1 Tax=Cladobotryum mycophilum TaxID=491253 RepID=A0ABR0SWA9_9HYPO